MSDPAVLIAIRDHLAAVAGVPDIFWPNEASSELKPATPPFITFDNGTQAVRRLTLNGKEWFDIRPNVAVHVCSGDGTVESDAIFWGIAQAFKVDTRIYIGAIEVARCMQTPVPDAGFHEGGIYRRNMILRIASYQRV